MIVKGHQNVESFIDAIAKHITTRGWKREIKKDSETIIFGSGYWIGEAIYEDADAKTFIGLQLGNEDYGDKDIALVEDAISLLEGFDDEDDDEGSAEPEEPEDGAEPEDLSPKRRRRS